MIFSTDVDGKNYSFEMNGDGTFTPTPPKHRAMKYIPYTAAQLKAARQDVILRKMRRLAFINASFGYRATFGFLDKHGFLHIESAGSPWELRRKSKKYEAFLTLGETKKLISIRRDHLFDATFMEKFRTVDNIHRNHLSDCPYGISYDLENEAFSISGKHAKTYEEAVELHKKAVSKAKPRYVFIQNPYKKIEMTLAVCISGSFYSHSTGYILTAKKLFIPLVSDERAGALLSGLERKRIEREATENSIVEQALSTPRPTFVEMCAIAYERTYERKGN